ncbi:SPFH domain-containing protein [Ohtaekwangia koreensis]|uniref:SPFH domain / Band 7 family protein n=1 Tax=Ohtaekwangia koreensis TaxID=688867 RepID=A0A1T5LQ51_9BACT|nr:SPFH domain-containing protein [Ohtaekwangia koreensis]SKC78054.1 SPFH domain / Band 7 family protein [Ohtaekwangia koreensis]
MNPLISKKTIVIGVVAILGMVLFLTINPFSWNDAGNRTVVERTTGEQIVQFAPGIFYAGFFAKEKEWPNQISVTYQDENPKLEIEDNGIEVGQIMIRFSDATTANVKGITQFILPSDEKEMILIHNTHRTPQSLVVKRLAPYTKECLQSSAQLMSSEKHYGGGRAQMAQDFMDQLKDGVYLLKTEENVVYDSLEKEKKRVYQTEIQYDKKTAAPKRKLSSIKEYGITVADAAITDVDYEDKVDQKLTKIIDAVTKSSISKQELMTAQQQTLTAKAKGEQALVEIEYQQKQEQTKQVVEAETKVKVAEQDKMQQKIAYEGAILEAKKIKELADAQAYARAKIMQADGALEMKLKAQVEVQKVWADAFSKYTGAIVPQFQTGGSTTTNGALNFMDIMTAKTAKDFALDLKNKN